MNGRIVVYLAAAAVCMYSRQTQGATAASTTTIPFYIVPYGHGGRNLQNFCGIGRCRSAAAATLQKAKVKGEVHATVNLTLAQACQDFQIESLLLSLSTSLQ